jgi:ATP-dependent Clp protease ATP-binding subunit ClpX
VGIEDIIGKRLGKRMIGFGHDSSRATERRRSELLSQVCVDDVLNFGLIPELVGRLPVISTLAPLEVEDLVRILTEPKNSLVRQYQKFFEMENAELEFTGDALREIARIARDKDTGARGLRSVVEEAMFPIMFELPEQEPGNKYILTPEVIRGEAPMLPQDDSAAA